MWLNPSGQKNARIIENLIYILAKILPFDRPKDFNLKRKTYTKKTVIYFKPRFITVHNIYTLFTIWYNSIITICLNYNV